MPHNQHHTEYAPPVLRAPSPASSIGTTYDEDRTSFSDCEKQLSQGSFERKWEERLELGRARKEEALANRDPLLVRPPKGSTEEQKSFEQVMNSLHDAVQTLEDNELFEQMLLRGSQVGLEPQPTTNDIDTLMRSLMVVPSASDATGPHIGPGRGRSNHSNNSSLTVNGSGLKPVGLTRGVKPGKRSRNGSRRN